MKAPDNDVNKLAEDAANEKYPFKPVVIADGEITREGAKMLKNVGFSEGFIAGFTAASNKTAAPEDKQIRAAAIEYQNGKESYDDWARMYEGIHHESTNEIAVRNWLACVRWIKRNFDSPASGKWTDSWTREKLLELIKFTRDANSANPHYILEQFLNPSAGERETVSE